MTDAVKFLYADAEIPGGNIRILKVEGGHLFVEPDLRDTGGDWFYWYFRVRNAAGRRLTVHFSRPWVMTLRGPAVSWDGGNSWQWLGAESLTNAQSFETEVPVNCEEVRFSMGMPYLEKNWRNFVARIGKVPGFESGVLCRSRKGRAVEWVRLGLREDRALHRVLLTCRHHACEMMANYALEGLLEAVGWEEEFEWLRQHVAVMAIPFVDKDGVEEGDQGKNRKPRDHNRDYDGEGLYPETRAIRDQIPVWADGRLRVALDLHCPWIRGGRNERLYFVGGPDPAVWAETERFSGIMSAVEEGPLRHDSSDNLPYGQEWNTEKNGAGGQSFSRWASKIPGVALAVTLEIPYADVAGAEVNQLTARWLGHDLARALQRYLFEK